MNCPACGYENADTSKFCGDCGRSLALPSVCSECSTENPAGQKFCNECGTPLAAAPPSGAESESTPDPAERQPREYTPRHLADRILQSKAALEGERKQVTVLFADVKGSMELAEELDPETWHSVLDRFFQILSEGVHRFEGTVNQYTGDGIMALFGAPLAHEDHAHRACYAALHLRDAVREYANEVRVEHGVAFGVRIGLNSGDVVVGKIGDDLRMDYTAQGQVVGLAQRMETLAESGHICVSDNTARLIEGYFELEDLGRTKVKGVSEPIEIYDLIGAGAFRTRLDRSRARGLSTFVGRDEEMATLESALEHALDGRARIVGVVADAGVGKSRLCFEFVERCRARGVVIHEAHCPAHGRTIPHLPLIELLRSYFGVSESDDARATREKIAGRLLLLDREFEDSLPLIWDVMRVPDPERPFAESDAGTRQQKLHAFVRRLVRARSEREPAVLFLDDLHWIDPATDEVLAGLVEALRGTRTLLLVNFRPEYRADWMQRSDYQQLPITPLGSDAIRELVGQLLGDDESVIDLPAAIEGRTAGNPFFTEEVVSGLIESGELVGERGAYRLVGSVDRVQIPPTVQAVLAARIDRLLEREKHVLQTASVVGRNFAQPLLGELSELPDADLDSSLRALCDADLLFERALYPVAEYAFKHPLTHEVAYGSQLSERRRSLHSALARSLESAGEAPALIAHHWDEACEAEPAVHWHREAAREAALLDQQGAVRHWDRILHWLEELDETPARLALASMAKSQRLWVDLRRGTTNEKAEQLYRDAHALAERAQDGSSLARADLQYAQFVLYSGQGRARALELANRAYEMAERTEDRELEAGALWALGSVHYFTGAFTAAVETCDRGLEAFGDDLDVGADVTGYSAVLMFHGIRATVLGVLGRPGEGLVDLEYLSREMAPRQQLTAALVRAITTGAYRILGDYATALAHTRGLLDLVQEMGGIASTESFARHNYGIALALSGRGDEARSELTRSIEIGTEANAFVHLEPVSRCVLAGLSLSDGDLDAARLELDTAFEQALRMDGAHTLIDVHRLRARGLRLEGAAADAIEAELTRSLEAIERTSAYGIVPELAIERAELCVRDRDVARGRDQLESARQLYCDMGATWNAERVEARIRELG